MKLARTSLAAIAFASLAVPASLGRAQQSFTLLPHLPGMNHTESTGISGDGLTVVGGSQIGTSTYNPSAAFRWTAADGITSLPLPDGTIRGIASAVSYDGSAIAGTFARTVVPFEVPEAYRWTTAQGTQILPTLPNATVPHRQAFGISGSGQVSVGYGRNSSNQTRAVYWDGASAPVAFLPSIVGSARAFAASHDGKVIAGDSGNRLFQWSADSGYHAINPPDEWALVDMTAMSDDASTIIGFGRLGGGFTRAFRWTEEAGMDALPILPGWDRSRPADVSADGRVVVGEVLAPNNNPGQAFYWSEATGIVYLRSLLYPSVPPDWTLLSATGVSSDGLTVTGLAHRNGEIRTFVATIPAPGMGITVITGCMLRHARRRR